MVDTIVAPSKTFTDILRSAACWLPIVCAIVLAFGWSYAIDRSVGFNAVAEQQMSQNARAEEMMKTLPADQRAQRIATSGQITRGFAYAGGVLFVVVAAIEALVLWGSFNFGLGAATTFGQVFAVVIFSSIPRFFIWILSGSLLLAGVGTDNFNMRNPVGTNLGFYLTDAAPWAKAAGSFLDVLGIWALILMILGMAIISRKSIGKSAAVVVGWWLLILLVSVASAAAFS